MTEYPEDMQRNIVALTGAGVSAESGLNTFRDADGLWEGHDVMEVATPQGFARDPVLVLDFYNARRRQLLKASPNPAHIALATLEDHYKVTIITQNVDDLHERAGSRQVMHLHGELLKARSTGNEAHVIDWREDLHVGDMCASGFQLRPHIVWFGEEVPLLPRAARRMQQADIVIIIGTSMQVYPAAGLVQYAPSGTPVYFIDPKPAIREDAMGNLVIIRERAASGVPALVAELIDKAR